MDGRSDERSPSSSDTSRLEDIDDVVHQDVHSTELGPHLQAATQEHSSEVFRLNQVSVRSGSLRQVELGSFLHLVVLDASELRSNVRSMNR